MQKVIPAILTSDPKELKEKLELFKGKSQWMHIDIMDGKFVQNTSVSLFALEDAHELFNLEIHLMVRNPGAYLEDCKEIGAKKV
ncbi:MAG: ribulose-phosphate 3-epimerase, partial [bacterium]|nr:ribulose-phosphate 3-epimerase [bacterium]